MTILACCPAPGPALMHDRAAHCLPTGAERLDGLPIAADHDRQSRFLRSDVAAGDRSIDAVDAAGGSRLGDLDRQRRIARGHIDEHHARAAAGQRAIGPQHHRSHIGRKTDDRENNVRGCGDQLRAVCPASAKRLERRRLLRVRLNTVIANPRRMRCEHMLVPITPVPIQPRRVLPAAAGSSGGSVCSAIARQKKRKTKERRTKKFERRVFELLRSSFFVLLSLPTVFGAVHDLADDDRVNQVPAGEQSETRVLLLLIVHDLRGRFADRSFVVGG